MDVKPPCEMYVKYILPAIRFLIAKKLIDEHEFTQVSAAKALGTTQAAISHYMHSKRGWKWAERLMAIEEIKELVEKSAEKIASSRGEETEYIDICELCRIARKYVKKLGES